MTNLVIDIYHENEITDLVKTKASGILGVIHKASQGAAEVDSRYLARRKMVADQGLLWGAYHFYDFSTNPKAQADHFISVAEIDNNTLPVIDWEPISGISPSAVLIKEFLEEFETKVGRKAMIYSGNSAKEQIKGKDAYFGSHRLWLAEYGSIHKVQESWDYPWLWQNSETGRIPGIAGNCDTNIIVPPMTVDRLKSEWSGVPAITTSQPVAPTHWYDPIERTIKTIEEKF